MALILYVDDEHPNRVVFQRSFESKFELRTVASGAEALELLEERDDVAVIVTDQRMPGMTGNELLARVKVQHPRVIRIVMTAYSDFDPLLRAVNDGLVARYVIKPWEREELARLLRWAVETYDVGQRDSEVQLRLLETERLATLGTVSAMVLHDLRQPLSYLTHNSVYLQQLLDAGDADAIVAELPELLGDLREGLALLSGITDTMGSLASTSPDAPPGEAKTDPVPAVRFALEVCRQLVRSEGGSLKYDEPAELPAVAIGSAALTQTLINLVSNAAHALETGGSIQVRVRQDAAVLAFEVADDGRGMDPDVLARASAPFFTTRQGGLGLGLLQCRRLIEGAGGEFRIESAGKSGTTVVFTVPLAAETA